MRIGGVLVNLPNPLRLLLRNSLEMLPVIAIIVGFQYGVIKQPFSQGLPDLLLGVLLILVGLTLFVEGLNMSLFPLGDSLVNVLTRKGNVLLLAAFAFCVGTGSTIAEPALIAVTNEAAQAAFASQSESTIHRNAYIFRISCGIAVGVAVTVGMFCVIKGWSTGKLVLAGYLIATALAVALHTPMTAIALDAGAAATSAINVPIVSAMGVGMASMIKGRNPVLDGFGLVALCSVTPTVVLLLVGGLLL